MTHDTKIAAKPAGKTSTGEAWIAIRHRQAFTTHGALWGRPGPAPRAYGGYLPAEYRAEAREAVYVVYSYSTPIGWENPDGTVTIPDVKYSVTTSKHQTQARRGFSK